MRTAAKLLAMALAGIAWVKGVDYPPAANVDLRPGAPERAHYRFPYRKAGLTERQAAAHLLSRFTYGAGPGQVDALIKMGLENWFSQQLDGSLPDDSLDQVLGQYDALKLTNEQVVDTYPRNGQVLRMAIRDGVINKDSVRADRSEYRKALVNYMQEKGFRREQELYRQFISQKILRAAYTRNQLREVMTDFWFNHFNVSITKNDCAEFIPAYERDVIRPSAMATFGELLLKTAKSPAMLYYLDNFSSSAPDSAIQRSGNRAAKSPNNRGLNENYAREVMELHTLGVDGGYTQQDVTQAARVLTGWGIYPMNENGKSIVNRYSEDQLSRRGFVRDRDFFFNANRHDNGEKTVLGHRFPVNGGYDEGVQLLDILSHHPSTAAFITKKIAVRFVSDNPPQSLLDKMTRTFREKNGDIRQVLITMVSSQEFWSAGAVREKTKSPFELAIGAVRSLHGTIYQPYQLYNWIARMGERKYYYQAPTGFPDKGSYWINTGALLNRMNFGLALAAGRIPGVTIDLVGLNNGHEPESAQAALVAYGEIILPERNLDATIRRLTPMLNDPTLAQKVKEASAKTAPVEGVVMGEEAMGRDTLGKRVRTERDLDLTYARRQIVPAAEGATPAASGNNPMLAQVVGIIIGSPEYQRR